MKRKGKERKGKERKERKKRKNVRAGIEALVEANRLR